MNDADFLEGYMEKQAGEIPDGVEEAPPPVPLSLCVSLLSRQKTF